MIEKDENSIDLKEVNESPEVAGYDCKETVISRWRDKIICFYWDIQHKIKNFFIKMSLGIINICVKDAGLIGYAKSEFNFANKKEKNYKKDKFDSFQKEIINLLRVAATFGMSGGSAPYYIGTFTALAKGQPLSPIEGHDDEWIDVGLDDMEDVFQNKRLGSVFKKGVDGKPYYLDAIVWKDQNDITFTGTVEGIDSKQYIKFPFEPKTFVIDVITDGEDSKLRQKKPLVKVFEYYEKNDTIKR